MHVCIDSAKHAVRPTEASASLVAPPGAGTGSDQGRPATGAGGAGDGRAVDGVDAAVRVAAGVAEGPAGDTHLEIAVDDAGDHRRTAHAVQGVPPCWV
jgi:hypothetical protein